MGIGYTAGKVGMAYVEGEVGTASASIGSASILASVDSGIDEGVIESFFNRRGSKERRFEVFDFLAFGVLGGLSVFSALILPLPPRPVTSYKKNINGAVMGENLRNVQWISDEQDIVAKLLVRAQYLSLMRLLFLRQG